VFAVGDDKPVADPLQQSAGMKASLLRSRSIIRCSRWSLKPTSAYVAEAGDAALIGPFRILRDRAAGCVEVPGVQRPDDRHDA
jgi:hypothetical protein